MIPPKLHFIWLGRDTFKESYKHAIRSAQLNTRFEIFLHTDDPFIQIEGVITRPIFGDYSSINVLCPAHLVDIIRCDILYAEGGIYSDLDVIWLRNPFEYMDKKVVIAYSNQPYKILCNAVMMSEQRHPAMLKYREWLVSIMPCKKYWIPANPYKIWEAEPDVLMIKKKAFFPVHYKHIQEATLDDVKESIAVHLFASMSDIETTYRNIFGNLFD
jgi:mannosyltransferase OCH1-like enzyme